MRVYGTFIHLDEKRVKKRAPFPIKINPKFFEAFQNQNMIPIQTNKRESFTSKVTDDSLSDNLGASKVDCEELVSVGSTEPSATASEKEFIQEFVPNTSCLHLTDQTLVSNFIYKKYKDQIQNPKSNKLGVYLMGLICSYLEYSEIMSKIRYLSKHWVIFTQDHLGLIEGLNKTARLNVSSPSINLLITLLI